MLWLETGLRLTLPGPRRGNPRTQTRVILVGYRASSRPYQVPRRGSKRFADLTPGRKSIIHMEGDQVNTRRRRILEDLIATTRD